MVESSVGPQRIGEFDSRFEDNCYFYAQFELFCTFKYLFNKGYDLSKKGHVFNLRDDPHLAVMTKYKGIFFVLFVTHLALDAILEKNKKTKKYVP